MTEKWLPVNGYEGLYEVSDHGRVKSLDRRVASPRGTRLAPGRVMRPVRLNHGHLGIRLAKEGNKTHFLIHRLVLTAFVGPSDLHALHRDDDKDNNHISNLYWGTQSDNAYDRVRNGNHHYANRTTCVRGHKFTSVEWEKRRICRTCRSEACRRYRERRRVI